MATDSTLVVVGIGSACPPTDEGLAALVARNAGRRVHRPGEIDQARGPRLAGFKDVVCQSTRWAVPRASFLAPPFIRAISESSGCRALRILVELGPGSGGGQEGFVLAFQLGPEIGREEAGPAGYRLEG